jgi:hypothetical protein
MARVFKTLSSRKGQNYGMATKHGSGKGVALHEKEGMSTKHGNGHVVLHDTDGRGLPQSLVQTLL